MNPSEKQTADTPTEKSPETLTREQRVFARVVGEALAKKWGQDRRTRQRDLADDVPMIARQ